MALSDCLPVCRQIGSRLPFGSAQKKKLKVRNRPKTKNPQTMFAGFFVVPPEYYFNRNYVFCSACSPRLSVKSKKLL